MTCSCGVPGQARTLERLGARAQGQEGLAWKVVPGGASCLPCPSLWLV